MENKITIIEGPPPTFEEFDDAWALGLNEGPYLYDTVITRLRTMNGHALVERCYRAWKNQAPMYLHYKDTLGLEEQVPIVAARAVDSDEGQILLLWLRQKPNPEEFDLELDIEIDDGMAEKFLDDLDDLEGFDSFDDVEGEDDLDGEELI
ncbi:MAG: hypothetical protein JEZ06_11725 [Anaerolineaceae bacterium]|nr:hypothetical protein [Anaerolineaceae bacterium]